MFLWPTMHNNAGPISKVSEEIANENAENCRCRQPHCRLTPHTQGTSANIRINIQINEYRQKVFSAIETTLKGHYALCFKTHASFGAHHENLNEDRPTLSATTM